MKRTISAEVGKGSANHNSRKFQAENVDGSRTHLNIDYCNERIQTVYHQLFDEALKRYNEKQARADRRIPNYYEKIRSGNQEKPFHEIILQIGNKEDMSATGEYAELARRVLDEYYQGFQERNPNLRVFSAHLHMDEATPHIHIDFVPFTTGSKRGLDTRVSLKQALAAQGFKGGTRGATEWAQWVQSEKEQLAAVMERYDIQWEQKGIHEKHLSVMDYKKQEREKEIVALDSTLAEKQDELETVQNRIDNFDQGTQSIEKLEQRMESDAEFQLPDPPTLMTAKTYKQRFVDPLIKKLKEVIREVFYHYYKALDSYHRLNTTNGRLYRENEHLTAANDRLKGENDALRSELKDFRFLRKVLGSRQIDTLADGKDEVTLRQNHVDFIVHHGNALLRQSAQCGIQTGHTIGNTAVVLDVIVAVKIVRSLVQIVALHDIVEEVLDQLTVFLGLVQIRDLHRAVRLGVTRGIRFSKSRQIVPMLGDLAVFVKAEDVKGDLLTGTGKIIDRLQEHLVTVLKSADVVHSGFHIGGCEIFYGTDEGVRTGAVRQIVLDVTIREQTAGGSCIAGGKGVDE